MGGLEDLIGRLLRPVRAGEKHLACKIPPLAPRRT